MAIGDNFDTQEKESLLVGDNSLANANNTAADNIDKTEEKQTGLASFIKDLFGKIGGGGVLQQSLIHI